MKSKFILKNMKINVFNRNKIISKGKSEFDPYYMELVDDPSDQHEEPTKGNFLINIKMTLYKKFWIEIIFIISLKMIQIQEFILNILINIVSKDFHNSGI